MALYWTPGVQSIQSELLAGDWLIDWVSCESSINHQFTWLQSWSEPWTLEPTCGHRHGQSSSLISAKEKLAGQPRFRLAQPACRCRRTPCKWKWVYLCKGKSHHRSQIASRCPKPPGQWSPRLRIAGRWSLGIHLTLKPFERLQGAAGAPSGKIFPSLQHPSSFCWAKLWGMSHPRQPVGASSLWDSYQSRWGLIRRLLDCCSLGLLSCLCGSSSLPNRSPCAWAHEQTQLLSCEHHKLPHDSARAKPDLRNCRSCFWCQICSAGCLWICHHWCTFRTLGQALCCRKPSSCMPILWCHRCKGIFHSTFERTVRTFQAKVRWTSCKDRASRTCSCGQWLAFWLRSLLGSRVRIPFRKQRATLGRSGGWFSPGLDSWIPLALDWQTYCWVAILVVSLRSHASISCGSFGMHSCHCCSRCDSLPNWYCVLLWPLSPSCDQAGPCPPLFLAHQ